MEWAFKMPPWDLTEPELNSDEANLSSVGGPGCSVDLKLGGLGDFGMADEWKQQSRALELPMEMSVTAAAGGPLKRPKMLSGGGGGGQSVSCLVDGCRDDLSHCRVYHRRHKVCEVHSKTPMVLVGGQEQRFCQQCSRFHLLVEFDEVKRSCRKRLDGHNRRRRKPQPDPIYGTKFPICSQIFPIAATDSASSLQPYPLHFINRAAMPPPPPQHFGSAFTWTFKEGKQAPLDPAATISPAAASSSRRIIFTNEFPWHLDSDCALSLLSSSTHTRSISLGHGALVDGTPTGDQLRLANLEYGIGRAAPNSVSAAGVFGSGVESEHAGTVMVSDAIDADLHCRRSFHGDGEGASDRASQSLPFSWY